MSGADDLIEVTIQSRRQAADGIVALELVPLPGGSLPRFEPGAHVDVHVGTRGG